MPQYQQPEHNALARIGAVADTYMEERSRLDPYASIADGILYNQPLATDYSHEGLVGRIESRNRILRNLANIQPNDSASRVAHLHLTQQLRRENAYEDSQECLHPVRLVDGPLSALTHAFQSLPTKTAADWDTVIDLLNGVPSSVASLRAAFEFGNLMEEVCTRRELQMFIEHCEEMGRADGLGAFDKLFNPLRAPDSAQIHLDRALGFAHLALRDLASSLRADFLEPCLSQDGVGPSRYRTVCQYLLGAYDDPSDLFGYYWGEYQRLLSELRICAHALVSGGSVIDAVWQLDKRGAPSDHALREHLKGHIQRVSGVLDGSHFYIPSTLREVPVKEAPASASTPVWLSPPSEDGSAPASFYVRPQGGTNIPAWRYEGTCYFALVPGAHLYDEQLRFHSPHLNRAQRTSRSLSPSRSWSAYAGNYVLRHDLTGESPSTRFALVQGFLEITARIIVDIGYNCHYKLPEDSPVAPGELCTYDVGMQFMAQGAFITRHMASQEMVRFVTSPGNALSYRIGERVMTEAQTVAARNEGADFQPAEFHRSLLALGPLEPSDLGDELRELSSQTIRLN